ncbi:TenA family protein [Sodalis sp. (in: enterobacteria)]|uniref:TenA family protein n=1 Tax=Sodalis sp. (in: enterobacteria) TaxID=1898979 RepID=UPI003F2A0919
MNRTAFEHGLYGRLKQEAGHHWQAYIHHDFVRQLATGTLPDGAFRRYLVQDYLFLIHFARAYALLAYKLRTLPEIRAAVVSLEAIVKELPMHVAYCAQWGLREEEMAKEPEASETLTYTRYVLDIGQSGDVLDLLVALIPCVAGYAEIGQRLRDDPATVLAGNPYAEWIQNYSDGDYLSGARAAIDQLERVGLARGAEQRFDALSAIFTTATRLESAFWQMGLTPHPTVIAV